MQRATKRKNKRNFLILTSLFLLKLSHTLHIAHLQIANFTIIILAMDKLI